MTSLGGSVSCNTLTCQRLDVDVLSKPIATDASVAFKYNNTEQWEIGLDASRNFVLQNLLIGGEPSLLANIDNGEVTLRGGGGGTISSILDISDVQAPGLLDGAAGLFYDSTSQTFDFTNSVRFTQTSPSTKTLGIVGNLACIVL